MIKKILCNERQKIVELEKQQIKPALQKQKTVWVDILGPTKEELAFLHKELGFHELALEDCVSFTQRPKVEDYPAHLFLVVHAVSYEREKIRFSELDIFLADNLLVTVHKEPIDSVAKLLELVNAEPELFSKGTDFLLYLLLSRLVESYFPVMDSMDDTIDSIEDKVFTMPDTKILNKTFKLKRAILELRKTVSPQREIVNAITRGQFPRIKQESLVYYRDTYDHLIRMYDLLDTYRDLLTGILDAYLSVVSNRMNEIMKVLTIIATIMMPLTLVTGIYGMNFQFMPEIHSALGIQYGYFFALGLMLVIGLIMVFFFKRKKWL